MDWTIILYALAVVGGLSLILGLALVVAGKIFRTGQEQDSEPIETSTPPQEVRLTALVRCSGGHRASKKYEYTGLFDCMAAMTVGGEGPLECDYGCLGMGTCVRACPSGALSLRDGAAVVDHERCTGCQVCVKTCPRHLIITVPYTADVVVACSSQSKGAILQRICEIGCMGCAACQRACHSGAIQVYDNLAVIDYDKCTGCGDCAEKCPRKLIVDAKLEKNWRPSERTAEN